MLSAINSDLFNTVNRRKGLLSAVNWSFLGHLNCRKLCFHLLKTLNIMKQKIDFTPLTRPLLPTLENFQIIFSTRSYHLKMEKFDWLFLGDNSGSYSGKESSQWGSKNPRTKAFPGKMKWLTPSLVLPLGMEFIDWLTLTEREIWIRKGNMNMLQWKDQRPLWEVNFQKPPIEWATRENLSIQMIENKSVVVAYLSNHVRTSP